MEGMGGRKKQSTGWRETVQACYIKIKINFIKRLSFLILQFYCAVLLNKLRYSFIRFRLEQLS